MPHKLLNMPSLTAWSGMSEMLDVIHEDLLTALTQEFTYTFGGCTIVRGLDGSYFPHGAMNNHPRR